MNGAVTHIFNVAGSNFSVEDLTLRRVSQHAIQLQIDVDSTVILERPTLKDHRPAIREKLAGALGIDVERVSVKFKTAEKVGPVGEGRAAEAQAVVTICRNP